MKKLPITFGIALLAVAIISAASLTDASALIDDGVLTKYSPNGKYKVDMSWEPAGSIEPGKNYDFTFQIILYEIDNSILFQYKYMHDYNEDWEGYTIGIENLPHISF